METTGEESLEAVKALHQRGEFARAEAGYRRILARRADDADAMQFLGILLEQVSRIDEAIGWLRRAVETRPGVPHYWNNLGGALRKSGKLDEAVHAFRQAIGLRPGYAIAYFNLGLALAQLKQSDAALEAQKNAIELNPQLAAAHDALGTIYFQRQEWDETLAHRGRALELEPNNAKFRFNYGNLLREQGYMDEAIAEYRKAIAIDPQLRTAHDSLVYCTYFSARFDSAAILREHEQFAERFERPLLGVQPRSYANEKRREKRLKVGYVSPDFRRHPVGAHLLAMLTHHDGERFEIVCYSDVARVMDDDSVTEKCRGLAHAWRVSAKWDDERLAREVQQDGIDVLVDCTLHLANNRLAVFARKPAPVQFTHFGYPGTTGLRSIDYRVSDPFIDPAGAERSYTEKTLRLDQSFWCYNPLVEVEPKVEPPAKRNGYVTFGCLNNYSKITQETARRWGAILLRAAGSRLILQAPPGSHQERIVGVLREAGVASERVKFAPFLAIADYLRLYNEIDVVLDCFPYNGHTTSLDALYMSVPVVTVGGKTCVARAGVSILNAVGLGESIADSEDEYVKMAVELSGDLARLSSLRRTLRARMKASAAMNAAGATRNLEALYRQAWMTWCAQ